MIAASSARNADFVSAVPPHATVLIARISRVVRQRFEQALTPLGLRQRQVVALSYLQGHGPTPQQTLAEGLCMDPSSTVCLLNELEDEDLVVRRRDRSDRRRGVVALSAKGELAVREVNAALQAVEDEILTGLDHGERAVLQGLLSRLCHREPEWATAQDV
jgi:DNA-binding MarR family transcriptional regulator